MDELFDVLIIGAGSAGMSAAIYAQRFGLKTLVVGKVVGGLLNDSHKVENYPGFAAIPGFDLMLRFKEHVDSLNIPMVEEFATDVRKDGEVFVVATESGVYRSRTLIFATGTKHRHMGIDREQELAGKGVSYCATCDAAFFKNVPVAVIGGGDAAAQAGALLAQHASKVYVIVRKDAMRAEPLNRERLEKNPKVEILYNSQVKELMGEHQLEGVRLSRADGTSVVLKLEGLFVEIGADVQTELAAKLGVALNANKEIVIDAESRTSLSKVYAAGDCANRKFKQAITGASEGVIAAFSAFEDLQK
jgi:thioredoxin reductase (NADPH)